MTTFSAPALRWLLDESCPGVRYLALRDLLALPADAAELQAAWRTAHANGPIAAILAKMHPDGYWNKPGSGYGPKYRSGVWSLIALAQLGASVTEDERIARACEYMLEHSLATGGQFSYNGTPSGTIDCLQGNLCWALLELGSKDPRLETAFDWMARTVTGEGIAPQKDRQAADRYYAYKCGPLFACGANGKLSCAWGAVKVMLAFGRLPQPRRTPVIERAIAAGVEFLLGIDPLTGNYPVAYAEKPSRNWWKFGFPVFYVTDLLQVAEALTALGFGSDPRLANTVNYIRSKQDDQGRWLLEYDYTGKVWANYGKPMQPNPWVTLRALRLLKLIDHSARPDGY